MRSPRLRTGLVMLSALALPVSACGANDEVEPDEPASEEPADDEPEDSTEDEPAASELDGTIRVAVAALPPGQGNPFSALGSPSIYTWAAVFDGLTFIDADGTPQPALASSWENTSPTTWVFTLRDDVTFSNGEPFNADAVVAAVEYVTTDEVGQDSVVANQLVQTVESATALDEYTVEFVTSSPDPVLPGRLGQFLIPEPGAWATLGPEGFASAPVGTGPYSVVDWEPNQVRLAAFEESWRAPSGAAELVIQEIAEATVRVQALQAGDVDLALQLSPDQVPTLEQAGATVYVDPAPQVMSLAFFTERGDTPLDSVEVRQALNHAVDRESIVENLLGGLAGVPSQGATPSTFGYNPNLEPYAFDPELARELLAQAGYPDGFEMSADVVLGSFPADTEIYQTMVDDLSQVGVNVTLEQIDFPQWLERYGSNGWNGIAFGRSWTLAPLMDAITPFATWTCLKDPAYFCDESVLPLIEAAGEEFDPEAREQILWEIQEITRNNPPSLFLVEQVDLNASQGLSGFVNSNRVLNYHEMALD